MGKQSASPYLKVPVPVLRLARVSWNGRTNCCDRRHQPGDLFLLQAGSPTLTVPACGIWVVRTSCGLSWFPWRATKAAGTFYEPQIKCHWRLKCLYEEKEDEKQPGNLNRGGGFLGISPPSCSLTGMLSQECRKYLFWKILVSANRSGYGGRLFCFRPHPGHFQQLSLPTPAGLMH